MADAINNPAPGMSTVGPDPNASTLGQPAKTQEELKSMVDAGDPLPEEWWDSEDTKLGADESKTSEVESQPEEEESEFNVESLDEILSGLDVDPEYIAENPDVLADPEVSAVFEKIAQAAGFENFDALQESIRERETAQKIEEILSQREADLTEEGWDEDVVKRQLALDKKELELQAKEVKYQKLEAEQKVTKAYKQYPLADVQLLRDFANAAPEADVSAFAKRLHDRSRTIAERSVSKYVAQKAKDGQKPIPRSASQGLPPGATRANDSVTADDSWLSILGFGR